MSVIEIRSKIVFFFNWRMTDKEKERLLSKIIQNAFENGK